MTLQIPPNCDLTLGLTCVDKSTPGTTVWAMTADERMVNPAGLVQGGFLAAMADSAMGASAVTAMEGRRVSVVNTGMTISLLRAVRPGDRLTCTARVLRSGTLVSFVEARIVNASEEVVATANSSFLAKARAE
ncbi:MAG: PaaI family thioesterase [Acidobacteriota bacterium]|nr:PaaI family thioesterase [Acidobacteriota bacterium]